jgi:pimeloyl-ACP methyl ester carboxylesterase
MGYGETSSQLDSSGRMIDCLDPDVVAAMSDLAGSPVDIVAHSYGAATAIEFVKTNPDAVRSLLLIEPVSFQLLNDDAYRSEWRTVSRLADKIISADAAGRFERAAHHYMSFWLGRLRWTFAPRKFRQSVIRTISKVAIEFSKIYELGTDLSVLRKFDKPVTLVEGGQTRRPATAVTEILGATFPRSTHSVIDKAGHMSPFTHRADVLRIIEQHFSFVRPISPIKST